MQDSLLRPDAYHLRCSVFGEGSVIEATLHNPLASAVDISPPLAFPGSNPVSHERLDTPVKLRSDHPCTGRVDITPFPVACEWIERRKISSNRVCAKCLHRVREESS